VRRGDRRAQAILDEALDLALATGELQRIAPVAAARAEAAWLRGDLEGVRVEAMRAYSLAMQAGSRWDIGRIALWLRRADALDEVPLRLSDPFASELAGRWREAADAWERVGCPYERALALREGDEEAQRVALEILEGLGAAPAAAIVRRELQTRGVRGLARGPRRSTRENPAGLTNRQMEVLELLAEGLSNREIGQRLFLSTRTVDHHVSALLQKLGAGSRARAAALARDFVRE
jgi:DNA-binding CsgD family transcriptional regulator